MTVHQRLAAFILPVAGCIPVAELFTSGGGSSVAELITIGGGSSVATTSTVLELSAGNAIGSP